MRDLVFFILWLMLACAWFVLVHRYNTLQARMNSVESLVFDHEAYFQSMYDLIQEW